MTTLSATGTLMNNYASISLLVGGFYGKAYLDYQLSVKAGVSQVAEFVTTDYLTSKYIYSVEISTDYYKKTGTDNM